MQELGVSTLLWSTPGEMIIKLSYIQCHGSHEAFVVEFSFSLVKLCLRSSNITKVETICLKPSHLENGR